MHNACLTARVGSKAERFAKARLKNMGFTNIRSIQNSSKHGLDIIAEHPGHLSKYFHFEVKGNAAASRIRLGSLQRQFTTGNQYAMNRLVNLQSQNHGLATTVLADITGGTHSIRSSIINVYQLGRGRRISKDVKWMIKSW